MPPLTFASYRAAGSLRHEIQRALREPDPVLANLKITRCHYLLAQALAQNTGRGRGGQSADLILAVNRTVLEDIGLQTARFVDWLAQPTAEAPLSDFLAGLPAGVAGQKLLQQAFTHYFEARHAPSTAAKQRATYLGNCFAVWHEHVRLEPYIQGAMPLLIWRCVTQRLLQFDIGPLRLAVAQDVPVPAVLAEAAASASTAADPSLHLLRSVGGEVIEGAASFAGTAARDWTRLKERMRYVFALFHAFHTEPQVCLAPYGPDQLAAIEAGQYPAGTWH